MRGADTAVVRGRGGGSRKESRVQEGGTWRHEQGEAQTGGKSSFPIRGTGERCGGPFTPLPQLHWGFRLGKSGFIQ